MPDSAGIAKLIWTTIAAVDHANRTGNYTVLRQLGSPSFQATNNPQALANVFAGIRQQRVDLSNTLLLEPVLEFPPRIENGHLRIRGGFRMRPTAVQFDLLFEWNQGWQLVGIAMLATPMAR